MLQPITAGTIVMYREARSIHHMESMQTSFSMAVNPSRTSRIRPHLSHHVKATCMLCHVLLFRPPLGVLCRGLLPHDVANKCLRHSKTKHNDRGLSSQIELELGYILVAPPMNDRSTGTAAPRGLRRDGQNSRSRPDISESPRPSDEREISDKQMKHSLLSFLFLICETCEETSSKLWLYCYIHNVL